MPEVSVIIPNYNHAPYLQQRINSVLNQTYRDFELIILDDCSKDNSRDIIEQYRNHPQVSAILYNETNSGTTFKQWDKGINLATGTFIWIAESDDWCEATLLETLVAGIKKKENCTVAYSQSFYVRGNNNIFHYSHAKQLEEHLSGHDYINQYLVYHSSIYNASMAIFRRETYFSISKDFTRFRFCGDWLFWSEMVSKGNVFISGKMLNYFRFHEADVSTGMYKTGNGFIEQFTCFLLLKQKFSIPDALYRKALAHYVILYLTQKKQFTKEVRVAVESLLNSKENKKHKWYLRKQYFKNRGKRIWELGYYFLDK